MHKGVKQYLNKIKTMYPNQFTNCNVLDVGSYDINGNNKKLFNNFSYTGIDIYQGANVDIKIDVNEYKPTNKYDVVICTEMLEHDRRWRESILSMYRLLKDRGLLLVTAAGPNRKEHGTTNTNPKDSPATTDYYRNISKEDVLGVLPSARVEYNEDKTDIYFYIFKL